MFLDREGFWVSREDNMNKLNLQFQPRWPAPSHLLKRLQEEPITSLPCVTAALLAKPVSQLEASSSLSRILLTLFTREGDSPSTKLHSTSVYVRELPQMRTEIGWRDHTLCKHAGNCPSPRHFPFPRRTNYIEGPRGTAISDPSRPPAAERGGLAGESAKAVSGRAVQQGLPSPFLSSLLFFSPRLSPTPGPRGSGLSHHLSRARPESSGQVTEGPARGPSRHLAKKRKPNQA